VFLIPNFHLARSYLKFVVAATCLDYYPRVVEALFLDFFVVEFKLWLLTDLCLQKYLLLCSSLAQ